jgi:hypothetical protein
MMDVFDKVSSECSKLTTKRYSTSFSSAIGLLHKDLQTPIYHIYGFVRFADEIVDTFHAHNKAELLAEFKKETYLAFERKISLNPILHSFQLVVNEYQIDHALVDAFFKSMEFDLTKQSYDAEGYKEYIYGSAEVVGLMCLYVFCKGDQQKYQQLKPAAQSLGSAFQKINFLRDIKADLQQLERVYFPGVDFNAFTETDKTNIEKDIYKDFLDGYHGILQLPDAAAFGVYVAYQYYWQLFIKIKHTPANVLVDKRIRVSDFTKTGIIVMSWIRHRLHLR